MYLLHLCFFKAIKNFDLNPHPSSSHLKILFIFSSSLFSFSGFLSFSMVETEEEDDEGSSFKKAWPFKLQCFFRRDFSGKRRSQSKHWWKFRDLSSIFSKGSGLFSAKLKQNSHFHNTFSSIFMFSRFFTLLILAWNFKFSNFSIAFEFFYYGIFYHCLPY